ncbi:hypothetical protein BDN72DRAFT_744046, partial [Pluteus cervinus]
HRTLLNLASGKRSMSAFNASKRKLTLAEERALVDFILGSADRGFALTHAQIVVHANAIILGRAKPGESVGPSWIGRFLERYSDEL